MAVRLVTHHFYSQSYSIKRSRAHEHTHLYGDNLNLLIPLAFFETAPVWSFSPVKLPAYVFLLSVQGPIRSTCIQSAKNLPVEILYALAAFAFFETVSISCSLTNKGRRKMALFRRGTRKNRIPFVLLKNTVFQRFNSQKLSHIHLWGP